MSYNEGTGNQTQKSIHPSSIPFILPRVVDGGAYPWDTRHPGQSANPLQGTIAHPFTHYGRFGNADRNTTHDFGLVEETAEAQGRLFKGRGRIRNPNLGPHEQDFERGMETTRY